MFEEGSIEAQNTKKGLEIYQFLGPIKQQIRLYPPLPQDQCEICGSSNDKKCHSGFYMEDKKVLIPNKLHFIGYYKRKGIDRLSEDIRLMRSLNPCNTHHIAYEITIASIQAVISGIKVKFSHVISIPSRMGTKPCIIAITKFLAKNINAQYLYPENWITHDYKLHEKTHVRNVNDYEQRKNLISKIFLPLKENFSHELDGANILLVDDIVQTGLTMNRIGSILMNCGAELIHGFAWARAIEGNISFTSSHKSS